KKGYLQKMFPKNGAKVPELRFAGFADDWEERKLGDYVIIRSGWSPSNFDINNNANNLFIKVDDLNYSTRVQEESQVKVNILSKYKKMKKSSTIFPKRGAAIMTNKVRMLGEDSYMDTNMMALEPKGIDPEYLYTFINKTRLYKIADTSTIPQINNKHIEPYLLLIPSLEEQHKIGSFFKQLDGTIALHQRKLDLLKEQKKGYLQKMFPKNGEKVPELRFAGFADDWEQRKLNEVSDIYDGTHQTPKYQDDGVMFLSVENIKTLTSNKFISREAFEDEFKIRPQRGDVLMTRIGDIGTANVVETDEDLAYYVSLALFKSEELNPYFLQASIYAPFVQDQIWKRTLHIAFPKKINKNEIGQVPINVPTLAEQTKIGSFFKQLDNTITLHQRKLDLLKEQKKGYLQKMFPKNGEKVPELRFAGFADDWEERKLSDIADRFDNLRVPITASDRKPGDTPYYGANGIQDYVEGFTHNGEFILVAEDGANDLKNYPVQYVNGKVWVNNHAHVLQGKKTITDNKFLMNAIKNFNIEPFLVGGGRAKLNADVMMKLNILLPTFVEQEKIGSLFSLLDKTIALHQRKLDLLKEQKKGYLQKMFAK
ncbi:MAG: restriction endonuclease subunit S, partial [Lactococcus chungangensis]